MSLPLVDYDLRVDWDSAGDLVRRSDRRAYPRAEDVSIPVTEERLRLRGIDERPALENLFLTFVRIDGEWSIAADDDLDDVGLFTARQLWDDGPVTIDRAGRFLLVEHPCEGEGSQPHGCARLPDDFLDLADRAIRAAEEGLPEAPMPDLVAVLAPGTQDELGRMIQATFPLDNFLAFATSSVDTTRGIEFTGHRIVLNWPQLEGSSSAYLSTVMTHELIHIATRALAGPFTPFFVDEGIAEYVARRPDPASLQPLEQAVDAGTFDRRLPADHEFRVGGPNAIFLSYKESQSAMTFLIDRWGDDAFMRFYRSLGSRRLDAGTQRYHVDRALHDAIGIGLKTFEREWADSIDPWNE